MERLCLMGILSLRSLMGGGFLHRWVRFLGCYEQNRIMCLPEPRVPESPGSLPPRVLRTITTLAAVEYCTSSCSELAPFATHGS